MRELASVPTRAHITALVCASVFPSKTSEWYLELLAVHETVHHVLASACFFFGGVLLFSRFYYKWQACGPYCSRPPLLL